MRDSEVLRMREMPEHHVMHLVQQEPAHELRLPRHRLDVHVQKKPTAPPRHASKRHRHALHARIPHRIEPRDHVRVVGIAREEPALEHEPTQPLPELAPHGRIGVTPARCIASTSGNPKRSPSCANRCPSESRAAFDFRSSIAACGVRIRARNAVFYGEKAIDRSPCGTGTSARMAQWAAKGKLKAGDSFVHESIIGSQFRGTVEAETTCGPYPAVIPGIEGWARITGYNQIIIDDEDDPYAFGFQVI